MIAVTATVRPRDSIQVLHLLEQCLRRHFTSVRTYDNSIVVLVPGVGCVLVTENLTTMRLDFVAEDPSAAALSMEAVEQQLRSSVKDHGLMFAWGNGESVPAQLR
jgi:hypothetical protein